MTLNIPNSNRERVVVIGGGFGGLTLVRKLIKSKLEVVLIDRNNYHLFQPLLYQVASGTLNSNDITFPFRNILKEGNGVYFRMAELERVDVDKREVVTNLGRLRYDYLVLATGSSTNFFGMKNIERQALQMKSIPDSLEIRNQVFYNIERALTISDVAANDSLLNIVIVGGGASGVELAGAFSDMKQYVAPKEYPDIKIDIYLVEGGDRLLRNMSEKSSEGAKKLLEKSGVRVILNSRVIDYSDHEVKLDNGDSISSHNLIWTSGVETIIPDGFDKAVRSPSGRIKTDAFHHVDGYQGVFAIGDAAYQDSERYPNGYPQVARVAIEQAKHLARNFTLISRGRSPVEYRYKESPTMATIRRNHAFAEFGRFRIKGFFGWLSWAVIHLVSLLGVKNKLDVLWDWFWSYITLRLPTRVIIVPKDPTKKATD